jgi:hypothetical protein
VYYHLDSLPLGLTRTRLISTLPNMVSSVHRTVTLDTAWAPVSGDNAQLCLKAVVALVVVVVLTLIRARCGPLL